MDRFIWRYWINRVRRTL